MSQKVNTDIHHITQTMPSSPGAQSIRKATLHEVLARLRENPAECLDIVEAMIKESRNPASETLATFESQGLDACVAAIQFALTNDEGMAFLRCWNEGEFDQCRKW